MAAYCSSARFLRCRLHYGLSRCGRRSTRRHLCQAPAVETRHRTCNCSFFLFLRRSRPWSSHTAPRKRGSSKACHIAVGCASPSNVVLSTCGIIMLRALTYLQRIISVPCNTLVYGQEVQLETIIISLIKRLHDIRQNSGICDRNAQMFSNMPPVM